MNSVIRKVTAMVEQAGSTVDRVERGKHFKFYLSTPAGKQVLVVSITASDKRAELNNRSILRRWAKQ